MAWLGVVFFAVAALIVLGWAFVIGYIYVASTRKP
jgi:hypothetical protein